MKTPKFWNSVNIISILLYPFSLLYYFCYKVRIFINKNKQYVSKIPIICVGNIISGGAGKTPVCIEIAKILKNKGKRFCFLSKGYKGKFSGVVDMNNIIEIDAKITGDEPLILKNYGDVFLAKKKIDGLKYINDNFGANYDYIILDDGLQNPTFKKDKIILVVDGIFGFGNNLILPSGPLRDKFLNIYETVDLVVVVNEDLKNICNICKKYNVKYSKAKIIAKIEEKFLKNEYIAFCGLGRPEKFKKTLLENNIKLKDFIIFEDHHFYSKNEIANLYKKSKYLITTQKDWVKLKEEEKKLVDFLLIDIKLDKNILEEVLNAN